MTNLPPIDTDKVASKLALKLADTFLQNATLETLAEALRDERDEERSRSASVQNRVTALEAKLAEKSE